MQCILRDDWFASWWHYSFFFRARLKAEKNEIPKPRTIQFDRLSPSKWGAQIKWIELGNSLSQSINTVNRELNTNQTDYSNRWLASDVAWYQCTLICFPISLAFSLCVQISLTDPNFFITIFFASNSILTQPKKNLAFETFFSTPQEMCYESQTRNHFQKKIKT